MHLLRGDDTIRGNGGEDVLSGGDGNDMIYGGTGPNHLSGNNGVDSLYGGAGVDDFNFREYGAENREYIYGFSAAQRDKIWIDSSWAADLTGTTLMAVQFRSGAGVTTASTAPQRVIYDTSTGELRFYRDGAGGDDAQIFAVLVGTPGLSAGDIHLF